MNLDQGNPFASWLYNVQNHLKHLSQEEIKTELEKTKLPCAILMTNIIGDFNFGAIIRSANAFNISNVFYFGKKKYDKRSAVGTFNYTNVKYISNIDDLIELKKQYTFLALENNIDYPCHSLKNFQWATDLPPLIIIGEEGVGIPQEILYLAEFFISIPMRGSVRSFNAANAAGITLWDYYSKCCSE